MCCNAASCSIFCTISNPHTPVSQPADFNVRCVFCSFCSKSNHEIAFINSFIVFVSFFLSSRLFLIYKNIYSIYTISLSIRPRSLNIFMIQPIDQTLLLDITRLFVPLIVDTTITFHLPTHLNRLRDRVLVPPHHQTHHCGRHSGNLARRQRLPHVSIRLNGFQIVAALSRRRLHIPIPLSIVVSICI